MPELPEVQTTVNGLRRTVVGLRIVDAWSDYDSTFYYGKETIKDPKYFKQFKKEVIGSKIVSIERRAKNILINLDSGKTILVHLRMTGHLLFGKYDYLEKNGEAKWIAVSPESLKEPFNGYIHFMLTFSNGKNLALSDMRKFAQVTLIGGVNNFNNLGPEPLASDFTATLFEKRTQMRPNVKIKQVLLDQSVIAGIGNIYADESLWYAGIHPKTLAKNIKGQIAVRLYKAIRKVLSESIETGGSSISDYRNIHGEKGKSQEGHKAYQMTGEKCSKRGCGGTIRRIVLAQRGTHFCDKHQELL
jgi:formamidopyrimidine-DNA glycosylase